MVYFHIYLILREIFAFVCRTAGKREIMKAYRKHAVKWHPDKYDGDDKPHAEKMFIDVAAAKEVLTDPGESAMWWGGGGGAT